MALGIACLGFFVTTRPPKTDKGKRPYEIGFVVLGLMGLAIVLLQGRARDRETERRDQREAGLRIEISKGRQDVNKGRKENKEGFAALRTPGLAATQIVTFGPRPRTSRTPTQQPTIPRPVESPAVAAGVPKTLSPEMKTALKTRLSAVKGNIVVEAILGDGKSLRLAQQLADVLKDSGWNVKGVDQVVFSRPVEGILIQVHSATTPGAGLLQKALNAVGLDAKGAIQERLPPDQIEIVVGLLD